MTYQELVKKVQTALVKADASAITEHIAVQVNVTGEAEGAFYIEIKDGVLYVEPYDYWNRDFLLTGSAEEILAIVQGKISLVTAIADSRILHEGNPDKAITLGEIIPVKKPKKSKSEIAETEAELTTPEEKPAKKTRKTKTKADEEKPAKPKRTRKTKTAKTEENNIPAEQLTLIAETQETAPAVETAEPEVTAPIEEKTTTTAKKPRAKRTTKPLEKTEVSENSSPKHKKPRKTKKTDK